MLLQAAAQSMTVLVKTIPMSPPSKSVAQLSWYWEDPTEKVAPLFEGQETAPVATAPEVVTVAMVEATVMLAE